MSYPRFGTSTQAILPEITRKRIPLFQKGHYRDQNLTSSLDRARCTGSPNVEMVVWSAGTEKPSFDEAVKALVSETKEYKVGDWLGPSWTNHWVKAVLRVPEGWRDGPVIFEFDPNCEGLIYTTSGEPIHAITGGPDSRKDGQPGMAEDRRVEFVLPPDAVKAGVFECYIEVSVNAMFGLGLNGFRHQQPDMNVSFQLAIADLVQPRVNARALDIDFQMLGQIARTDEVGASKDLSMRALHAANDIMNTFKRTRGDEAGELDEVVAKCRKIAAKVLGEVKGEGSGSDSGVPDDQLKLWAIGHCHIDTAWLWCYTHTQQKIARSWSTQIDLIKRFPDFHFAASSAQQYAWLDQLYPSLFTEVKAQVKAGRFHPVGGAWLEHDCLIPSGESLCRQYLYGQRYFEEHFGKRCREAWLPDTFGYASQLPQILRLAGIDYFFTQKLSWNNINTFPHTTFNWVGLDGSQVLAHMTPVDSYNSQCNYDELLKGVNGNKNLGVTNQCLMLFGNGDGGGGPTPRMLEKLERLRSASAVNPEMPTIAPRTPVEFFEQILAATDNGQKLPATVGELYFELHRGIYTSQANIKKGNHELEHRLRDLEYFATLASVHTGYTYPRAELDEMWKDLMLNQFHDVLPGTSIAMAIQDALDIYARRIKQAEGLINDAIEALGSGDRSVWFDPYRRVRAETLAGERTAFDEAGLGSVVDQSSVSTSPDSISNDRLRLTVTHGRVTSLYDLQHRRELICPGVGTTTGGLMLYQDFPLAYDAWDAEVYHQDCGEEILFDSVEVEGSALRCTAAFGSSVAVLTFSLDDDHVWVDAKIDWMEKHKFLKFALPTTLTSLTATYGTQYGLIERPTHRNTTQEQAKFEVFGHGFADLSENGYGVTLASAYKYGYSVENGTMRISLLRSSTAPDPHQDEGEHRFSFAIMPHRQRFLESGSFDKVLAFINPVTRKVSSAAAGLLRDHAVYAEPGTVVLDAVKRGEDGKSVVLRMYEGLGGASGAVIRLRGLKASAVRVVNILEEDMDEEVDWSVDGADTVCRLPMRGFEVKTLRVEL